MPEVRHFQIYSSLGLSLHWSLLPSLPFYPLTSVKKQLILRLLQTQVFFTSFFNNRIAREESGPRGIWGRVQGVGLVQGVTRSGLVCDSPSARSADAREARFLVELAVIFICSCIQKQNLRPSSSCNEPITMGGDNSTLFWQQTLKLEEPFD